MKHCHGATRQNISHISNKWTAPQGPMQVFNYEWIKIDFLSLEFWATLLSLIFLIFLFLTTLENKHWTTQDPQSTQGKNTNLKKKKTKVGKTFLKLSKIEKLHFMYVKLTSIFKFPIIVMWLILIIQLNGSRPSSGQMWSFMI